MATAGEELHPARFRSASNPVPYSPGDGRKVFYTTPLSRCKPHPRTWTSGPLASGEGG